MPGRVAYNALALRPAGSGVQTYIRELLRSLASHPDLELVAAVQEDAKGCLPARVSPIARPTSEGVRRALAGLRDLGPADLVHGLDVDLPWRRRAPMVSTVHDLAVFDVPWAWSRRRVLGEQELVAAAARRADALITMSHFSAERVKKRFGRESFVIPLAPRRDLHPQSTDPPGVSDDGIRRRYGLGSRFVLCVGNIEARKDVEGLVSACRLARLPLVLAGAPGGQPSRAGPSPGDEADLVTSLGYVPAAHLGPLYRAATVVCYPSLYEGFGLPPVEAMSCGAPVVATAIPPLVEVLGDAAILVAPGDTEALANALAELFADEDRRLDLAGRGRLRVGALSWETTARRTLEVYSHLGLSVASLD